MSATAGYAVPAPPHVAPAPPATPGATGDGELSEQDLEVVVGGLSRVVLPDGVTGPR